VEERIAVRFRVYGRVQGVFFRASTAREAVGLGLSGHALNLPDGSVEVLACGAPGDIERLRQWLGDGPPMARVERVASAPADPTETPAGFVTG
jgi:acylphosphatase